MGLFDRICNLFGRRSGRGGGLDRLDGEAIRDLVEESLQETEATSEIVEQAQDAHERARDLIRQGLFEEAVERFREASDAWHEQARICREQGFKNLWRGRPAQVGREMEDLRITYLDLVDLDSFHYLHSRARLRREQLREVLMTIRDGGAPESEIYKRFPEAQREEIRSIIYHAQRRGWLDRGGVAEGYRFQVTEKAPDLEVGPSG